MKTNYADAIANEMSSILQSEDHLTLFGSSYKVAKEEESKKDKAKEDKKCEKCSCCPCKCDSLMANDVNHAIWDNAAASDKKESDEEEDSSDADDASGDEEDSSDAKDGKDLDAGRYDTDGSRYGDVMSSLDEAFAHLLTASTVLDAIGFDKSSALSLDLAGFLVEAKKKVEEKKKAKKKTDKKKMDSSKEKSSDKSSGKSSKEDSSSSKSSGSSKKSNPFAKKK